jgi:hypothetical protein
VRVMRYVAVLMKFWASLGRRRGIDRDEQWFRQEGATPHTINDSLAWLRERFKDRLISRKCEIEWTAHSIILRDVPVLNTLCIMFKIITFYIVTLFAW